MNSRIKFRLNESMFQFYFVELYENRVYCVFGEVSWFFVVVNLYFFLVGIFVVFGDGIYDLVECDALYNNLVI